MPAPRTPGRNRPKDKTGEPARSRSPVASLDGLVTLENDPVEEFANGLLTVGGFFPGECLELLRLYARCQLES